jgi:CHAT domain-containing protein/Tfp pilus assembly protein PilF
MLIKQNKFLFVFYLILTTLILGSNSILIAQTQEDKSLEKEDEIRNYESKFIASLELGQNVEQEIDNKLKHIYQIKLIKGQYLHITVNQKQVDIKTIILNPTKEKIIEYQGFGTKQSAESVVLVAQESGIYNLELYSTETETRKYEIIVKELREATQQDIDYLDDYTTAHKIFEEAYNLYLGQTKDSLEKAINKYQEALALYDKIQYIEGQTNVNYHIGLAYSTIEKHQRGLDYLFTSLLGWRKMADSIAEAKTLKQIAEIYTLLGENNKALEHLKQAKEVISKVEEPSVEADIAFNLGTIYFYVGDNQNAIKILEKALGIYKAIQDLPGTAITLNLIAVVYSNLGDNQKALELLSEVVKFYKELKDPSGEARAYNSLGVFYVRLADYENALSCFDRSLTLRTKLGIQAEISETLNSIAVAYKHMGKNDTALEYFEKALNLQVGVENQIVYQGTLLNNIGTVYLDKKENDKALTYFNKSIELHKSINNVEGLTVALTNVGLAYSAKSEPEKALEFFAEALKLHQSLGTRAGEAETLFRIAVVNRDTNKLDLALESIESSIAIIESLRVKIKVDDLRISYFSSVQEKYKFYVSLLMRLHEENPTAGYDAKALIANESSRARSLLDLINQSKVDIRKGVDTRLLKEELSLRNKLNELTDRSLKNRLSLEGGESKENIATLEQPVEEINRQLQQIELEIKNNSPAYIALRQPEPISIETIQKDILDKDTILLEYFLGETHSFLWVVSQTSIKSYQLPKRSDINDVAKKLYNSLSSGTSFRPKGEEKQIYKEYITLATTLSNLLLLPASDQLKSKKNLLIVADGILHFIPFSALAEPNINKRKNAKSFLPLIVNHVVVNEPSISVLSLLKRQELQNKLINKTIALFGDPVFGIEDERVKVFLKENVQNRDLDKVNLSDNILDNINKSLTSILSQGNMEISRFADKLSRLLFTGQEIKNIANLLPEDSSECWLSFDANLENVVNQNLTQYRYVHFATHGLINNEKPRLTALALCLIDNEGKPKRGFLTLNEIFNLNLNADMVTLSACGTALGKEVNGEGLVGLSRGFMYAGAKRLVVSLWNANDRSTAELMLRFYRGIFKNNLSPAEALRNAQLSMMKEPQWLLPYYWASFQLQGEK